MDADCPICLYNSEGCFFFPVALCELNLIPCHSLYVGKCHLLHFMNELTQPCGVCISHAAHLEGGW